MTNAKKMWNKDADGLYRVVVCGKDLVDRVVGIFDEFRSARALERKEEMNVDNVWVVIEYRDAAGWVR